MKSADVEFVWAFRIYYLNFPVSGYSMNWIQIQIAIDPTLRVLQKKSEMIYYHFKKHRHMVRWQNIWYTNIHTTTKKEVDHFYKMGKLRGYEALA